MRQKSIFFIVALFFLACVRSSVQAEKISLRMGYKTNAIQSGDLFSWIDSYGQLWEDWQSRQGGTLEGQLEPPKYGANFEFELRFPLAAGFSLHLAGSSPLKSQTEGSVRLNTPVGDQTETHFISNKISAIPFKIGVSYSIRIPTLDNLSIDVGAGRLILFAEYENLEKYDLQSVFLETEYNYWYEIKGDYRSECLGFYANLTAEYRITKFAAVVVGVEKNWAKMDGFKGSYSYTANFDLPNNEIKGKASLYFYESSQWGMGQHYSILAGHIDRPVDSDIQNVRQGRINLGGFSLMIGLRLII